MNEKKKKEIDALWIDSDFGHWAICAASDNAAEAEKFAEKVFQSGYFGGLKQLEEELAIKLRPYFNSAEEWDDYLQAIDKEYPDLARFMIIHNIFTEAFPS